MNTTGITCKMPFDAWLESEVRFQQKHSGPYLIVVFTDRVSN